MATGDQNDIYTRLKGLLPPTWFGDSNPILTGALSACASALSWCYSLYLYAKLQTRLSTATDGWLDLTAYDFFGKNLQRSAGQSDDMFRNQMKISLFRERGTRQAIIDILEDMTGKTPYIFEPQRPMDTGAYGMTEGVTFSSQPTIYKSDWSGITALSTASRTNLLTYSEQFDNSNWSKTRLTVTANALLAPDGTISADKLTPTSTASTHSVIETITPISSTQYVFSVFLKAGEYTNALIQIGIFASQVASNAVYVDLSLGVIISANDLTRCGISSVGNGWYRFWTTVTTTASPGSINASVYPLDSTLNSSFTADGVSGIYAWGAQLEANTVMTSYISTASAIASITDYSISSGLVTIPSAIPNGTKLLWSGVGNGFSSGKPIVGNYSEFAAGGTDTTSFQIKGNTTSGSVLAYGVAGGYGSLMLPYQAFVTAYRPSGSGIPYIAGYSSTPSGYSVASRGEYASQSMITGSITDAQVYEAIAAVKMEGTLVWVRLQ